MQEIASFLAMPYSMKVQEMASFLAITAWFRGAGDGFVPRNDGVSSLF
ncbi:MAG: hypothetical protein JWP27_1599, partial [Flaviaesturariibacter sp.]|nr:hypothetical protein [Flaviaesturariibacter sp.]